MSKQRGFTLIELVVVIVILGILAATALPKFVDLGKDARIASLKGLAASLESGARLGRSKCATTPNSCNVSAEWTTSLTSVVTGGRNYKFQYGWPTAWYDDWDGIWTWVDYTGFTKQPYVANSHIATFTKDGAPTPATCRVDYKLYHLISDPKASPIIEVINEGC